jgi:hypothetical protein
MFAMTSRYYPIPTAEHRRPDGSVVVYARRRMLPRPDELTQIGEHTVGVGERLDHIATQHFGDPELFWRIADANRSMRPQELTATPGRRLRITLPPGMSGAAFGGLGSA